MMRLVSRTELVALLGITAGFIAAGLVMLPLPFLRDQGIYAYIAWCWSEGLVPYRDAFGHKGPLLYLVYLISLGISKGAMWGPNLADLLSRALTVVLVYLCGRVFFDRKTGFLAALFTGLPLIAVFNSCWWNAQAETFMMPLLVLSLLLVGLSKGRYGGAAAALSGIFAAQAVMLKSTALWHLLFLLGLILPDAEKRKRNAALLIAGFVAGAAPWIIYFYAKGSLGSMFEALVIFNSFHAGPPPGASLKGLLATGWKGLWTVSGLFLVPAAVPLVRWVSGKTDHEEGTALGFLLFSLLQVAVQMKFFLYHWLVVIPALGLLTARGFTILMRTGGTGGIRAACRITGIGILVLQTLLFLRFYILLAGHYQTVPYLLDRIDRTQYYSRFQEAPDESRSDVNFLATWSAAHHIRSNTRPGDRVLVFGYEPAVYYLSARLAPTRFHSDYPLTFEAGSESERRYRAAWRDEFMRDIRSDPPAVVVLVRDDVNVLEAEDSFSQAEKFEEFRSWLNDNYRAEIGLEDFEFFIKK